MWVSEELSAELYELSNWIDPIAQGHRHTPSSPCYSLGYLLWKLPKTLAKGLFWRQGKWHTEFVRQSDMKLFNTEDSTPENAAAELCIELFKNNILTKEQP